MRINFKRTLFLLLFWVITTHANPLDTLKQEYKDFRTYPRINKAYLLLEEGKSKEAKKLLQKVLLIDQKNQTAIDALVNICVEEKDKTCIKKYEKKIDNVNLGYFYKDKASKTLKKKNYTQTVKYAQQALDYPLNAQDKKFTRLLLLQAYLHLKQYDHADKLIGRKNLSISQIFEWSKISDNLGNSLYASSLANELPAKEKYLKWSINLFIKNKNYLDASKAMENLYKINPSNENEEQLTYLYDLTHQKESILNNYKKKLKRGCNVYALEFLLNYYKNNKKEKKKVLEKNYPYSCLKKEKKINLALELINFLNKTNPRKAKRISKHIIKKLEHKYKKNKSIKNKNILLNLYASTGKKSKILKIHQENIKKGCNKNSLIYLLNYYKKNLIRQKTLLDQSYPYSCFSPQKRTELTFQLLFHLKQKKENQKIKHILQNIQKEEIDPEKYLLVSNMYTKLKMPQKSLDYALAYLKIAPNNIGTLKKIGYAYVKLDNKELASHYLLRAAKLAPQETALLKDIGYLTLDLKEYKTATHYWDLYLQKEEDPSIALKLASLYYYELQEFDKAKLMLDKYEKMNPKKNKEYHLLKAKLGYKDGECTLPLKHYKKALQLEEDEYTRYAYIHLLHKCKKEKKSLQEMKKLTKEYPHKVQYKKELAYMFEKQKKYKEMVKSYKEIIEEEPKSFENNMALAYAYKKTKNNQKAKKYFKKAIDNSHDIENKKLTNIKSEIHQSSKNFNLYIAQSLRLDKHKNTSTSPVNGATYAGFGDIQLSYKPQFLPKNSEIFAELSHGHRNGKIIKSMQPSIGIRYKPFKKHNVILSAQQLIKRNNSTRNDTLLRTAIGINSSANSEIEHTAYLDSAYFTRANSITLYSNYEGGKSYHISKNMDIKPYFTTGGTYSNDNLQKESVSKLDIGLGVALTLTPDETKYELPQYKNRLKLEARKQYAGNAKDDKTLRLQWEFFY